MGRLTLLAAVFAAQSSAFVGSAKANPCADVEWTQKAIGSGFAGVPTRKQLAMEHLMRPLFGDDVCTVGRPVAFSTAHRVTCMFLDGVGSTASPSARQTFDRLSKTLKECLSRHNSFDDSETEYLSAEIIQKFLMRSYDSKETWSLKLWDKEDPKVILTAEYEAGEAEAPKQATLSEPIRNVLMGSACQTMTDMERLARSNFAGVETKRVRTESALAKPLGDATECLVARDLVRGENVIACHWVREDAEHAKWAGKIHEIRLSAARACRKGWTETAERFGARFTNPAGDTVSIEMRAGEDASVTGVAVSVKSKP